MRSRRDKDHRKTNKKRIYVLPNLFTSASLFGGFYAIIATINGRFETAAIAILISCVFDALDGKIARFTHTTSQFGAEYDSLSDLVAFGVAPGLLAFQWALEPFGRLGWLASFMYVICAALRLARFNVQQESSDANYFKGLPVPGAASFIASLILFISAMDGLNGSKHILVIILMYLLSFLMVSSLDYLSFKSFNLRKQNLNVLVGFILILMVIAYKPKFMLFFVLVSYIFSGPVITIYRFHKKRSLANRPFEDVPSTKKE